MSPQQQQTEEERRMARRAALRKPTRTQAGPPRWVVRGWVAAKKKES